MTKISFGEFCYNPDNAELTRVSEQVTLDSRQQAILNFFIQNPDRIISRDELQSAIWQGTIVTDNAISKSIANLRKVLSDDSKSPQYIQTVPKKGYKFIAQIIAQNEPLATSVQEDKHANIADTEIPDTPSMKARIIGSLIAFALILLMLLVFNTKPTVIYGDYQPVNTTTGAKQSLLLTANPDKFLYINRTPQVSELWLQSLKDNSQIAIDIQGKDILFHQLLKVDNHNLIFKGKVDSVCGIYQAKFNPETYQLGEITQQNTFCNDFTVHDIVAWGNNMLFLGHNITEQHQSQLYKVSFNSAPQAMDLNMGDDWIAEAMDLSENQQKLLITAYNGKEQTRWYSLQLSTGDAKQLNQIEGRSRLAAWSQLPNHFVYSSSDNGFKLFQQSVNSKLPATLIVNLSESVCCEIARLNNKQDYLFTSYDKILDLHWLNKSEPIANSNVRDRNPQLFHKSDNVAFISDRSGITNVYIDSNNQAPEKLNIPLAGVVLNMRLSDNDRWIVAAQPHRLWVYSNEQNQVIANTFVAKTVSAVHWLSDTLIAVPYVQQKQQGVLVYNAELKLVAELDNSWLTVVKDRTNDAYHYYIDNKYQLYQIPTQAILQNPKPASELLLGQLPEFHTIVAEDNRLYLHDHFKNLLYRYSLSPFKLQEQQSLDSYLGFDVKNGDLMYTQKRSFESNIYKTLAQQQ